MRVCLALGVLFLSGACSDHKSRSSLPAVFASATIGPAGGDLVVTEGKQAGLRLVVPAGALPDPVTVRVVDVVVLPPSALPTSFIAPPGQPFRIEPAELRFVVAATLRMPYVVGNVRDTSPGNVRGFQTRELSTRLYDPHTVDIANGYIEIDIKTVEQFEVVTGPRTEGLAPYLPALASTVQLGGVTFASEAVPPGSRFEGPNALRWRIRESLEDNMLYFDSGLLSGRECSNPSWQEVWSEPYSPWLSIESAGPGLSMVTSVFPGGSPLSLGGQIFVWGHWSFAEPRHIGDRFFYDVVKLRLWLAWNRADLGIGQREHGFWFSPGVGLIAISQDGVVHERSDL